MAATNSNIEPLAREIAERVCRKTGQQMTAQEIAAWVDAHWQSAAAQLEAGIMNDDGSRIPGTDWELGLIAYRERMQRGFSLGSLEPSFMTLTSVPQPDLRTGTLMKR